MSPDLVWVVLGSLALTGLFLLFWFWPKLLANQTVATVYRQAIKAAEDFGGIEWLTSEEGIGYRKLLVRRAYALLPSPFPWKVVITEDRFCSLVETAFQKVVRLSLDMAEASQEDHRAIEESK